MAENALDQLRIETPPTTLRAMALERLRTAIISGLFKPGQRLVERKLCDQLGVSRSVIREVIRHLDSEGLVSTEPNQGPIVARIGWQDAWQIYQIRASLESMAVHACARLADNSVKALLRSEIEEIESYGHTGDPVAVLRATTSFYEIIFRAGGHLIAGEIVQRLNGRISQLRVMTLRAPDRMVTGPQQLRKIYEAIDCNDPELAAEACRNHVATAARIAEELLRAGSFQPP